MVLVFGLLFVVIYIYVALLKLIPGFFRGFSLIIFVTIIYSYFLHNILCEFSDFDLWDQNVIIIFSAFIVTASFIFKENIKTILTIDYMQIVIEALAVLTMHLTLYDSVMSLFSTFLYSSSFTYIFWKILHRYLLKNDQIIKTDL